MSKAVKSTKRVSLLNAIMKEMKKHEIFGEKMSRHSDKEGPIKKALFSNLDRELPKILHNKYGLKNDQAKKIVKNGFLWEQNINTTVNNFSFFATNHRPDAVFDLKNELRIAIEIKLGNAGHALRSGIGQALVYSTQFDFVIYFFVDTSSGFDIRSSFSGKKECAFIKSLWDSYNIRFDVV